MSVLLPLVVYNQPILGLARDPSELALNTEPHLLYSHITVFLYESSSSDRHRGQIRSDNGLINQWHTAYACDITQKTVCKLK